MPSARLPGDDTHRPRACTPLGSAPGTDRASLGMIATHQCDSGSNLSTRPRSSDRFTGLGPWRGGMHVENRRRHGSEAEQFIRSFDQVILGHPGIDVDSGQFQMLRFPAQTVGEHLIALEEVE